MVADVGDPAIALPYDLGLIRTASLQILMADEPHVAAVGDLSAVVPSRPLCGHRDAEQDHQRRTHQMPSRHNTLL